MYGGLLFRLWGAYQVKVGLNNYELSLSHHLRTLRGGRNVCIFPTGKIIANGASLNPKGGVGFLSEATQLPVVPVLIEGAELITIRDLLFLKRKVRVTFGKALYVEDIFKNSYRIDSENQQNKYELAAAFIMAKVAELA